ncbi:hypothetical protein, partial [Streptomyces sp. SBT349]|uniref:hypothetical protein n=1 Tax=Streptomyces sp. SBT349 TaxID=1580539 RepID=UPI00066E8B90
MVSPFLLPSRGTALLKLTLCGTVAAFAAVAGAGPAAAEERAGPPGVRVTPPSPRPGDDVDLHVSGCEGTTGTARSDAFVAEARLAPAATGGTLFGEARVDSATRPGVYPITVECHEREGAVTGRLVVAGHDGGSGAPHEKPGHEKPGHEKPGHATPEHETLPHARPEHHEAGGHHPTGPVRALAPINISEA